MRVNGLVVALTDIDLVTLPLRVNGIVVGLPDFDLVIVVLRVNALVVGLDVIDLEYVGDLVYEVEVVIDRVRGNELANTDRVRDLVFGLVVII